MADEVPNSTAFRVPLVISGKLSSADDLVRGPSELGKRRSSRLGHLEGLNLLVDARYGWKRHVGLLTERGIDVTVHIGLIEFERLVIFLPCIGWNTLVKSCTYEVISLLLIARIILILGAKWLIIIIMLLL